MRHKGTTAINIRALVVSFFSVVGKITTGAGMCRVLALWTMKHKTTPNSHKVNKSYPKIHQIENISLIPNQIRMFYDRF